MTRARQLADMISDGVIGTTELADDAITPVKLDETGNYTIAQLGVNGTVTADGLTVGGNILRDVDNNSIFISGGNAAATGGNIGLYGSTSGNSNDILLRRNNVKFAAFDGATGDVNFYATNGTTQAFHWDAADESLGIGTTSPSDLLELSGSTAQPAIRLTDSDVSGLYHRIFTPTNTGLAISADTGNVAADSFIRLDVDGTEAMRITPTGIDVTGSISADGLTVDGVSTLNNHVKIANGYSLGWDDITTRITGNSSTDLMQHYTAGVQRMRIASNGNISFYEDQGTTPKMVWTAADESLTVDGITTLGTGAWPTSSVGKSGGRVAIVSSTENQYLLIANTNGTVAADNGSTIYLGATGTTNTANLAAAQIFGGKSNATSGNFESYLSFKTSASNGTTTEKMHISSTGDVGIGTSSVDSVLHLQKSDATAYSASAADGQVGVGPTIYLENPANSNNTVGGQIVFGMRSTEEQARIGATGGTAPALTFGTGDAETMRIDSSNNLLVAKTALNTNTVGLQLESDGYLSACRDGGNVALINRKTSDGALVTFQKDGSTVGSIGSRGGVATNLILRTATGQGAGIGGANSGVLPCDEDGLQDDEINLGASGTRWKDLYLSGDVFVNKTTKTAASDDGIVLNGDGFAYMVRSSGVQLLLSSLDSGGASEEAIRFVRASSDVGSIDTTSTATSYNTSSDYRLKTDAQPMTGATDRLKQLNPINFEWIADGTRVDGFLAHEAQAVVPEAVTGAKDAMRDEEYEVTPAVTDDDGNVVTEAVMGTRSVPDYQGIDQSKLVPLLVATIQELEARITALENAEQAEAV